MDSSKMGGAPSPKLDGTVRLSRKVRLSGTLRVSGKVRLSCANVLMGELRHWVKPNVPQLGTPSDGCSASGQLVETIGQEPHTPLDDAVRAKLAGMGCLNV